MSQLIDRLQRDLGEIAAGADPSPFAWESIVARLDEDEPSHVTLVLAPAAVTSRRPVWLAVAAAALVLVIGAVAVLVTRAGDDHGISTVEPEPTTESSGVPPSTATDVVPTHAPTTPPAPSPTTVPPLAPGTSGRWWPQTTLEGVRAAQELADAGDPAATWQLDENLANDAEPWGAEIFARFIEQELGWDEFADASSFGGYMSADGGGDIDGVVFVRCAPGETNPLSPLFAEAPEQIRACAPTIDDFSYETVSFNVSQPERRGPSGIWIVDRWEILPSKPDDSSRVGLLTPDPFAQGMIEQLVPPTDDDVSALLQAFLGARVAGEGAEQYLLRQPAGSPFEDVEVPLLYATTTGAPYDRFESERVRGPVWPNGWMEYEVRLFAGQTVVEQYFHVIRHEDGELELLYGRSENAIPTTENGQSVPLPYSVLDGEVTFTAAPPWKPHSDCWDKDGMVALDFHCTEQVRVATTSPVPGCGDDQPAESAQAIVRTLMADPTLQITEPVPARIAGVDALQLDVTREFVEPEIGSPITFCWLGRSDARIRLYLIDLPEGMSAPALAISVMAPAETFEDVLAQATPILESIEIQTSTEGG